ncbi:MAG: metallophosphoesterase [Thermomicrobiales bacterium]|nr:metallophosphoesterase [Thermomicrobiales bacterium]
MRESRGWRLGVVADAHSAPPGAEPYVWQNTVDLPHSTELLDAGLHWLAAQQLDALVLLGDLTEAADPASFTAICERATALGVPVFAVPGNCDVDPVDRSLTAFDTIQREEIVTGPDLVPAGPNQILELVHLAAADERRLRGVRRPEAGVPSHAVRVVLTHYPVLELESDLLAAGFRHSGDLTNRVQIEADLHALDVPVVVVHGHLHVHDARISGNLLHLSCGPLIEPPHLVSVIELDSTDGHIMVQRRAHSVRTDDVERLPVFAPFDQRWTWSGGSWDLGVWS